MASISKDKSGNRTVQFIGADKKRRSVRLGKIDVDIAKKIAKHIEHLAQCWKYGSPPCPQTFDWVMGLLADPATHWLYDRLAAVKLVAERERPEDQVGELTRLGAFLTAYINGRTDLKPGSLRSLRQVERRLVDFFGADKRLAEITPADADDWRRWLESRLGDNTVRRSCGRARQFFHAAVRRRLIDRDTNPFAEMKKISVRPVPERNFFVTPEVAGRVLDACPDLEWRLVFSLSRYGGLRCPSEHLALTWECIDWERERIRIPSPKTERHEGKGSRIIPLFPELKGLLEQAFDEAPDGAVHVIQRYRDCNANLRTQLLRIIGRAGLDPWPRLFQNLRASRATELAAEYPAHVVAAWMGHSVEVSAKHYLQVTDSDFDKAVHKAVQSVQITSQSGAVTRGEAVHENAEKCGIFRVSSDPEVVPDGLEPSLVTL